MARKWGLGIQGTLKEAQRIVEEINNMGLEQNALRDSEYEKTEQAALSGVKATTAYQPVDEE